MRASSRYGGLQPKISRELQERIVRMRVVEKRSIEEIAFDLGISCRTAFKYSPRGINVKQIRKKV